MKFNIPDEVSNSTKKYIISGVVSLLEEKISPQEFNNKTHEERCHICNIYIRKFTNSDEYNELMEYVAIRFGEEVVENFKKHLHIDISDEDLDDFKLNFKELLKFHSPKVVKAFWLGLLTWLEIIDE